MPEPDGAAGRVGSVIGGRARLLLALEVELRPDLRDPIREDDDEIVRARPASRTRAAGAA
jgi:hypothetical protein